MGVPQLDPELLGDGGYTCVGVVDNDCSDVNAGGTDAEDGFAVEKFVDVYDTNLVAGGVVSIARVGSYLNASACASCMTCCDS